MTIRDTVNRQRESRRAAAEAELAAARAAEEAAKAREAAKIAAAERAEAEKLSSIKAQAEAKAKAIAEEKAHIKAEARAAAQARVQEKAEAKAEARAAKDAIAHAKAAVKARKKADKIARAEAKAEAKAAAKAGERAAREALAQAKAEAKAEARVAKEVIARAKAEAKAEAKVEARVAKEAIARAKADVKAEVKAEAEAAKKAAGRAKAEAKAAKEAAADAQTQARAKEKAEASARKVAEAEAKAVTRREDKIKSEVEAKAKAQVKEEEKAQAFAQAQAEVLERQNEKNTARVEAQEKATAKKHVKEQAAQRAKEQTEVKAREKAEAKAYAEVKARARAEAKAEVRAYAKILTQAKAQDKADALAQKVERLEKEAQEQAEEKAAVKEVSRAKAYARAQERSKMRAGLITAAKAKIDKISTLVALIISKARHYVRTSLNFIKSGTLRRSAKVSYAFIVVLVIGLISQVFMERYPNSPIIYEVPLEPELAVIEIAESEPDPKLDTKALERVIITSSSSITVTPPAKPVPEPIPDSVLTLANWQINAVESDIPAGYPRLVVVIDDLGMSVSASRKLAKLPAPLTVAFLPYANRLPYQSSLVAGEGHELLVHMPMAPKSKTVNPGNNALLGDLEKKEFEERLDWNLSRFSGFIGINNHMGSRLTEQSKEMGWVMAELKERGLVFLDSVTTSQSVASEQARLAGVPTLSRNVFLDNERDPAAIRAQLDIAMKMSKRRGLSIAIGHPYPETLSVLKDWLPTLEQEGVILTPLSAAISEKYFAQDSQASTPMTALTDAN